MSITELKTEKNENLRKRYRRYYTWLGPLISQPKNRAYTFLGLSLFTVAFFVSFAIRPTINTIIGLQKQIDDEKIVEKKLQDKITALSQLQAEYEIIQPDLPILNEALPTTSNIVDLVQSAERLSASNQASISAVQIGETFLTGVPDKQNITGVIPISFLFTVEGNYNNLATITKQVSNLPRLMALQNLLLIKGLGKVIGTVKINAFYLPLK